MVLVLEPQQMVKEYYKSIDIPWKPSFLVLIDYINLNMSNDLTIHVDKTISLLNNWAWFKANGFMTLAGWSHKAN